MAQDEVIKFLESVRDAYVDALKIAMNTQINVQSVNSSLRRLLDHNEVMFIKGPHGKRLWRLKEGKDGT